MATSNWTIKELGGRFFAFHRNELSGLFNPPLDRAHGLSYGSMEVLMVEALNGTIASFTSEEEARRHVS